MLGLASVVQYSRQYCLVTWSGHNEVGNDLLPTSHQKTHTLAAAVFRSRKTSAFELGAKSDETAYHHLSTARVEGRVLVCASVQSSSAMQ